ncbi:MAG: DNA primase [Candidatus Aminicenantes bacterium]|nr:DNA primase [Candidatus Aminicenantes bacterium]
MDFKDQIKEYISIVDVASLYVSLKPAGKNFKALCPFHSEKTPSFFVMPEKNTFTCFGCNRFGDIFTMVQEMENLSFVEAMHFLADKFNIPLEKSRMRTVKKDEYLHLNELALDFFRQSLHGASEGKEALSYLRQRGLTMETIERFSLGYAPDSWDALSGSLRQKRASLDKAVELGLLMKSEKNRIYDRFRGRVIFPIFSETGAILAFGGRTVLDDKAKYLNSPDSPLFKKGNHLYGFHLSKNFMKEEKAGLLVEGYMDAVSLYQEGFRQVAATMGTALTEKQIHLLKRFCSEICLFYDRDAAGEAATIRNIERMFEQNVNPRIVLIEGAKDPDEFVRRHGAPALREALLRTEDGFNFLLAKTAREFDLSDPAEKRRGLEMVLAAVSKIGDPIIREEYVQRAASFFRVRADLIHLEASPAPAPAGVPVPPLEISLMEEKFLEALLRLPEVIPEIREFFGVDLLANLAGRNIILQLFACHERHGELRFDEVTQRLSSAEKARLNGIFTRRTAARKERSEIERDLIACVGNFQKKMLRGKVRMLNQEIATAERERRFVDVKQLMKQKDDLIKSRIGYFREGLIENES